MAGSRLASLVLIALLVGGLALGLALFLATDLGLAMRATGNNPQMAKAVGIEVDRMVVLGLALSNGLVALSGALFAQYEGFANIQMGIGVVVTGVATLMVGEALLGRRPLARWIAGVVVGAVVFRLLVAGGRPGGAEPQRAQAGDRALRARRAGASAPAPPSPPAGRPERGEPCLRSRSGWRPCPTSFTRARRTRCGRSTRSTWSSTRGSFTVVLGTNGSGKSSLLGAIAGSLPAAGGRVYLDGQEVTRWTEQRRARLIGRVFQNPFTGTAADLSVAENLMLAARRGMRRRLRLALGADRRRDIRAPVARLGMGLEDRLDTPIGLLSGGQRQALTVLMATMVRPMLLLLDEHTAALDPRSAELVVRLTRDVITEGGLTTLMVTHSMAQAVQLGDRVLVMHRGRLVYDITELRRQRLAEDDLLQLFDQLRWADRLDESAAEMLRDAYV